MVEFALVAPLLLFLLFGIVDFGRAIFYENEITNAVRDGARVAILPSNPCNTTVGPSCTTSEPPGQTVCGAIEHSAALVSQWSCGDGAGYVVPSSGSGTAGTAYVEIDQSNSSSTCPAAGGSAPGSSVTTPRSQGNLLIRITIHYYYRPLTPILSQFFPSTFYLGSSICVRPEY